MEFAINNALSGERELFRRAKLANLWDDYQVTRGGTIHSVWRNDRYQGERDRYQFLDILLLSVEPVTFFAGALALSLPFSLTDDTA